MATSSTSAPDGAPVADGQGSALGAAVRPLLRLAAEQAGLDCCLLVRQQGEHWVVLEATDGALAPVGTAVPWSDTLCQAVVAGQAPELAPDVRDVPLMRQRVEASGWPVRGYVSVPLRDDDGRLLGTLCGLTAEPLDAGLHAHGPLLRTLAGACAGLLAAELALGAARARADLLAPDVDLGHHTGLLTPAAWRTQLAQHDSRCASLGATAAVVLVDVDGPSGATEVLLAVLAALREGDAVSRLPSGALALLLVDTDGIVARARAAALGVALAHAGSAHRAAVAATAPGVRLSEAVCRAEAELQRTPWTAGRPAGERSPAEAVRDLLERARDQLGLEVAFLSQLTPERQVFEQVVAPPGFPALEGTDKPADDTVCQRVLDGRLPAVMADTSEHPAALEVGAVAAGVLASCVTAPVRLSDGRVHGTVCCLSTSPTPGLSGRDALVLQVVADAVGVHVEAQLEAASERRRVQDGLAALLATGGPSAVYQPVVATGGLGVVGVEALTRFPDGRSPLTWFLEAARHGVGVELELAACRAALAALPALAAEGRFLAVNLSPAALADPALADLLEDVRAQGLLTALVVEVTEHEPVDDYDALNGLLAPWRADGLRLAVDDTGAGHASLRHVLLLEPDVIKLDRELVTAVETDRNRADLVAALVAFASRGGRSLVAEGVETAAELARLTELGVDLVQGFHLARPSAEVVTVLGPPHVPLAVPGPRTAPPRGARVG